MVIRRCLHRARFPTREARSLILKVSGVTGLRSFGGGACITGEGPVTVTIDIQLRIAWDDDLASLAPNVTFILRDDGIGVVGQTLI